MTAIDGGFVCGGKGMELPFLTNEDLTNDELRWCCYGAAEDGATACTCWDPVYDLEQQPPNPDLPVTTRRTRCVDCAFRPDSPERARGDDVDGLPNFFCHQGFRRPIAYRHSDGRVREYSNPSDYQPPIHANRTEPVLGQVPYKADGTPADRCAGWAQIDRKRHG